LLIGIGPKIALVPFLALTGDLDAATRSRVIRKMLTTSGVVALVLVVLGEFLARLLHFSTGSLSVAGGLILVIISVMMVLGSGDSERDHALREQDPLQVAIFPLAVPYVLNPAGIVAFVTVSAEAGSIDVIGMVLVVLALVLALDAVIFRWAGNVSDRLNPGSLLVTEKIFGFLLAALAVQLVLDGLASVGAIDVVHH